MKYSVLSVCLLTMGLFFISCNKESNNVLNANTPASLDVRDMAEKATEGDCVDIQFPVSMKYADGKTKVVRSMNEMDNLIDAWYEKNTDIEKEPTIVFPINVKKDGKSIQVTSEDDLLSHLESCCDNADDMTCYELQYPITMITKGGKEVIIKSEEEEINLLEKSFEDMDAYSLKYPVKIVLADKSTRMISSEAEMSKLDEECEKKYGYDEPSEDELAEVKPCFDFVYPLTVEYNGKSKVIHSEKEFDTLDYDKFDPVIKFPYRVILNNGQRKEVRSESDLDKVYESCD